VQEPDPDLHASNQSRQAGGAAGDPGAEKGREPTPDIRKVVQEVKSLLKEHPELKQHQEVKRIMVQLKYYNTELEKMRSLAPNIPPEKAAAFKKNFQTTFNEIAQKIGAAYNTLINEEIERDRPKEQLPVLKRYDFSTMDKLFREQIANAAKIYSTIRYADQERYQMREVLVELSAGEPFYSGFIARELRQYQQLAPFGEDHLKITRAFGSQLQHYYDRYAEWLSP
jgi:DNA-binding XRE family transcriptional regulator